MSIFDWRDDFATGNQSVDTQHRALFKLVKELHAAILNNRAPEMMSRTLTALERYITRHFSDEQRLMEATAYPELRKHVDQHRALAERAHVLIQNHRDGALVLGVTVSQFLAKWLSNHILVEDKTMMRWVQSHEANVQRAAPVGQRGAGSEGVR